MLSVVGIAVNSSALQMTDFLPFVHLHVQFDGQLTVQSSQYPCDVINSSNKTERERKREKKRNVESMNAV